MTNLKQDFYKVLATKKVGVCAGKFRILHQGHKEYLVSATLLDLEELHIIISESENTTRYSTLIELKQAISEILAPYEINYYIHISEPLSGEKWDQKVVELVNSVSNKYSINDIIIFNSKEDYENVFLTNYYLKTYAKGISATNIEENPYLPQNYLFIAPEFARYMNKKIVISGVATSGKTQLCAKLAAVYNTKYSKEHKATHAAKYIGGNEFFLPNEVVSILINQLKQDKDVNLEAKRLLFLDTDPVIILNYFISLKQEYIDMNLFTKEFEIEYDNAYKLICMHCKTYKVDRVFLLKPKTETSMFEFLNLKNLYEEYDINYEIIEFGLSYEKRFHDLITRINKIMKY